MNNPNNESQNQDFFDQFYKDPSPEFVQDILARLNVLDAMNQQDKACSVSPPNMIYRIGQSLRGTPAILVAAMMTLLFAGMILVNSLQPQSNSLSQTDPVSLANLQPITQSTIRNQNLQLLRQLGRGTLYDTAWSPDESTIAVASGSGVYLHDARDFSDLGTLPGTEGEAVRTLTYSRDGTKIAAYLENSQEIVIWEAATKDVLTRFSISDTSLLLVYDLEFDATGERLAVSGCAERTLCTSRSLVLLDAETGEIIRRFDTADTSTIPVISPDWSVVAIVHEVARTLTFRDVETGAQLKQFLLPANSNYNFLAPIAFSSDGSQMAIATGENGSVQIYDLAHLLSDSEDVRPYLPQNDAIAEFRVSSIIESMSTSRPAQIYQMSFSSHDTRLVIMDTQYNANIWSLAGNTPVPVASFQTQFHAALSQTGRIFLVLIPSESFQRWDLSSISNYEPILADDISVTSYGYTTADLYKSFSFSEDHSHLLASTLGPGAQRLGLWDLTGDEPTEHVLSNPNIDDRATYSNPAINSAGTQVVFTEEDRYNGNVPSTIILHDVENNTYTELTSRRRPTGGQIVFDDNNDIVMVTRGNATPQIIRWSEAAINDGEATSVITLDQRDVGADFSFINFPGTAISPDGSIVLSAVCSGAFDDCETTFQIWDAQTGNLLLILRNADPGLGQVNFWGMASLSADNNTLAISLCPVEHVEQRNQGTSYTCESSSVMMWDISEATERLENQDESDVPIIEPLARIDGLTPFPLPQISFAPAQDGDTLMLAVADDNDTTFYDVNTQTGELGLIDGIMGVGYPQFSPDGELLALSRNGVIELWGVPND